MTAKHDTLARRALSIAIASALLTAAGCSAHATGNGVSAPDVRFLVQGNAICQGYRIEKRMLEHIDSNDPQQVARYDGQVASLVQHELDELRQLQIPPDRRSVMTKVFTDADAMVKALRAAGNSSGAKAAAVSALAAIPNSNALNSELDEAGLTYCGPQSADPMSTPAPMASTTG